MNFRTGVTQLVTAINHAEWELAVHDFLYRLDPQYTGEALLWLQDEKRKEYTDVAEVVQEFVDKYKYREVHADPEE